MFQFKISLVAFGYELVVNAAHILLGSTLPSNFDLNKILSWVIEAISCPVGPNLLWQI
jgi:hypothetical protein